MGKDKTKWSGLLNGPVSKPELTAKELLEASLSKYRKKQEPTFTVTVIKKAA